jgi:hypothetical protein
MNEVFAKLKVKNAIEICLIKLILTKTRLKFRFKQMMKIKIKLNLQKIIYCNNACKQ